MIQAALYFFYTAASLMKEFTLCRVVFLIVFVALLITVSVVRENLKGALNRAAGVRLLALRARRVRLRARRVRLRVRRVRRALHRVRRVRRVLNSSRRVKFLHVLVRSRSARHANRVRVLGALLVPNSNTPARHRALVRVRLRARRSAIMAAIKVRLSRSILQFLPLRLAPILILAVE